MRRGPKFRRYTDYAFSLGGLLAITIALGALAVLIVDVAMDGAGRINLQFLTHFSSRNPAEAGILPALVGSLWLVLIAIISAIPLGVASAIYLEEYAPHNRLTNLLEVNIYNLAGVPSIVYGILGLGIFVRFLSLGRSVLAGGLTLGILLLPIIIIAAREAIRSVPNTFREASYAIGATRWQTIYRVVLPAASPGIITGAIVGISRIVGEAAPLIVIGGSAFVSFLPKTFTDEFTALPLQIYTWISYPKRGFHINAAAGILILLGFTLLLNSAAIIIRYRLRKRMQW